jgi:hypothetical protein
VKMSNQLTWKEIERARQLGALAFAINTCESIDATNCVFTFESPEKADAFFMRCLQENMGAWMSDNTVKVYLDGENIL